MEWPLSIQSTGSNLINIWKRNQVLHFTWWITTQRGKCCKSQRYKWANEWQNFNQGWNLWWRLVITFQEQIFHLRIVIRYIFIYIFNICNPEWLLSRKSPYLGLEASIKLSFLPKEFSKICLTPFTPLILDIKQCKNNHVNNLIFV